MIFLYGKATKIQNTCSKSFSRKKRFVVLSEKDLYREVAQKTPRSRPKQQRGEDSDIKIGFFQNAARLLPFLPVLGAIIIVS